jgi:hypothetical protein
MAGDSPLLSCRANVQFTRSPRNLDGAQCAGPVAPRASVRAAWQFWRLGREDRALIVGGVFCRAHGWGFPAAFLPGQRTVYAVAEEFGCVSVRGACRSPGFRARGLAVLTVGPRGSRVNSGRSVLPGAWPGIPRCFPAGPAYGLCNCRGWPPDRLRCAVRCSPTPNPSPRALSAARPPQKKMLKRQIFSQSIYHLSIRHATKKEVV